MNTKVDEMNVILGLFAFSVLAVFLGILVFHVPRIDLMSVIGLTAALAAWDLYTTLRSKKG